MGKKPIVAVRENIEADMESVRFVEGLQITIVRGGAHHIHALER